MSTIVGLAQDFVGSNNVNLLFPSGQFGTRLQGGKDSASPRYIYTRLGPLARSLFREEDDRLLKYLDDDGQSIEPLWYLPVLPLVLLNGADGIGTGWSTSIPNYSPKDVAENVKRYISGMPMEAMVPWYKGFEGEIARMVARGGATAQADKAESFSVSGVINVIDEKTIEIVELPLRKWTQDYKDNVLEPMVKPVKKDETPFITDYKEHHTDTTVHFVITMPEKNLEAAQREGIYKKFKLLSTIQTSNMHLFSADGQIKKYASPEDIITEFCETRLKYYGKRKDYMVWEAEEEMKRLDNKVRFILMVVGEELVIAKRKKAEIESDLDSLGFDRLTNAKKSKKNLHQPEDEDDDEEDSQTSAKPKSAGPKVSFDYLLGMPLWSLSLEKVQELQNELEEKKAMVAAIRGTDTSEMWLADIDDFLGKLEEVEEEERKIREELVEQQLRAKTGKAKAKGRGKAKQAPKPIKATGVRVAPLVVEAKAAPTKRKPKAASAKATGGAPAQQEKVISLDSDDEEYMSLSLMERSELRRKMKEAASATTAAAAAPAATAAPKRKPVSKKLATKKDADEDVFEMESPDPPRKTKTTRKVSPIPMVKKPSRAAAKKNAVVLSDSEMSDSEENWSDGMCDDDSDEDFDDDSDY